MGRERREGKRAETEEKSRRARRMEDVRGERMASE